MGNIKIYEKKKSTILTSLYFHIITIHLSDLKSL